MLDDLRQQANEGELEQLEEEGDEAIAPVQGNRFLGMTPQQRFLMAALFSMWVCILGALCLLATGKVGF